MDKLIFAKEEFHRLYNCSFYDFNVIPVEKRRNISLGIAEILITGIEMILYLPCMFSIWGRRRHTCYKFMFVMGILDLMDLAAKGPLNGWLTLRGTVFCSAPTAIYIVGAFATAASLGQQLMDVLLALNRCFYFVFPDLSMDIFPEGESWTWAWTLGPLSVQVFYTIFGTPALFSAVTGWWTWNPHVGYANEMHELYVNNNALRVVSAKNTMLLTLLPFTYIAFFVAVLKQSLTIGDLNGLRVSSANPIFKQVAVISFCQCSTAFMSLYLKHSSNPSYFLTLLHQFLFTQTCGIAPVLYLTLNKKIKKDVKGMFEKYCKREENWNWDQKPKNHHHNNSHAKRGCRSQKPQTKATNFHHSSKRPELSRTRREQKEKY